MRGELSGPFWIGARDSFPPVHLAHESGLLAVGGDLRPERLLAAYRRGIFPWPHGEHTPMLWFSPDPRYVLRPERLHIGRTLRRTIRRGGYELRVDSDFAAVVRACAGSPRPQGEGTWITPAMLAAYETLHELGYATSVETWCDGELADGLYGVTIGRVFFGESMFARRDDASKVAMAHLTTRLGFELIDCQQESEHLRRLGAEAMAREEFVHRIGSLCGLPRRH